jgi:ATP synthase protein I
MPSRSNNGWDDDAEAAAALPWKRLSRDEAAALRAREPAVSPWRVVAAQAVVGLVVALVATLVTGRNEIGWSALYGATAVVLPGALMARGMTSAVSSVSPIGSAVSFMLWESVKIAVSLAMLGIAGRIVQPLVWPALLIGLVLCIKVYWVALLWRRHPG